MRKKKILILGSSGSIGTQTLDVVRCFPDRFSVQGVSVFQDIECVKKQIQEFSIPSICVFNTEKANILQKECKKTKVYSGEKGLIELIRNSDAELVVLAIVGEDGVEPAKEILKAKKDVALATKEVMVVAGEEIMVLAKKNNVSVHPIDSEHSAIWQCLRSGEEKEVEKIWLTCSGGPFLDAKKWTKEKLKNVSISDALSHPNWDMGKKISIDSATLMNKALEFIEAVKLFCIPPEKIEVVIHPESFLHSAVEFKDGSIIGQIGTTDMRTPIAYALFYPERCPLSFPKFSFFGKTFHFEKVDEDRFPSLRFAKMALKKKKCKELNTENEKAVSDFLLGKIGFLDIFKRVGNVVL